MKILMINVTCGSGSTGRICTDLAQELEKNGHEVKIAYGRDAVPEKLKKYAIRIGTDFDLYMHVLRARLFDSMGLGSTSATRKFLKWVDEYDPDVIHLHNIHGYYINIKLLFEYIKKSNKKIIWTLHDCWSFTGHCAYFEYVNCKKWKIECCKCKVKDQYPKRFFLEKSKKNYYLKKALFTDISDITLVTPSEWLAKLVKQSFLKEYPVKVIHNGINLQIFTPTESDIKQRYHIEDKKIVLGVASVWDRRKGLDTFVELSEKISDSYQIVLVGLNNKQIKKLPDNIISINKTNSPQELAELYSVADVFVNPTLEDNYPTTNLEAIACNTPVITYDTGGSSESAKIFGKVTEEKGVDFILKAIYEDNFDETEDKRIDYRDTVYEYIEIYKVVLLDINYNLN